MRYIWFLLISAPVTLYAAAPVDEAVAAAARRYFDGAVIASGTRIDFPSYLIADLNGDGQDDLVVALTDDETLKRGEGCYALGIVNSFRSEKPPETWSFHEYDCFKEYRAEKLESIAVKAREITMFRFRPIGPCIRLTLKYDGQTTICWYSGRYGAF